MKNKIKKTKTLRFDIDLLEKLEYLASEDRRSLNNFMEGIFEKFVADRADRLQNFYQEKFKGKKSGSKSLRDMERKV